MWQCPPKTSRARRAAALGGSRARALRYVQVEEDSRHDEPSPRRGRRDGISRGTRRGGPHAQRRGGGASRDLSRSRVWAHALPRARGPSHPPPATVETDEKRTWSPSSPSPAAEAAVAASPRRHTPRRRRAVRPSAWTNGPGRTRGPGNRRVARVRGCASTHQTLARDAPAFDGSSKTRTVRFSRHVHGTPRRARRHADDEDVTPEERPEKPRANARRGRHGRANTVRKILTNLVRVSRLYIKTQGSASRRSAVFCS